MNFGIWSLLAAPLMLAFLLLYMYSKRYKGNRWGLLAKSGGSYAAVLTAAVGFLLGGGNPFLHPLFWGLVLCVAADALLEVFFPSGVVCFGLGHICFILWLIAFPFSLWSLAVFVPLYIVQFLYFRKEIRQKPGRVLFYLYPAVLMGMGAVGAVLPFTLGSAYLLPALGAILFIFSDFLVAKGLFHETGDPKSAKTEGAVIMVAYYAALYFLAAGAWVA